MTRTDVAPGAENEDRTLVRAARAGDETAFAGLVTRFAPALHRYVTVRGLNAHDAEDVVQETFIRAHAHLEAYDPRWAVSTWLFTIARRIAASHARRRREQPSTEAIERHAAEYLPMADGDGIWEYARSILDVRQAEALWLRYAEDRTPAEIGAILGISGLHVRVLLFRARNRLARTLEQDGRADSGGQHEGDL